MEESEIGSIKQNDSSKTNISVMTVKVIKLPIKRQRTSNGVFFFLNAAYIRNTQGGKGDKLSTVSVYSHFYSNIW